MNVGTIYRLRNPLEEVLLYSSPPLVDATNVTVISLLDPDSMIMGLESQNILGDEWVKVLDPSAARMGWTMMELLRSL
jgi:hypothetical protein